VNRDTTSYFLTFSGLALALLVPVIYTLAAETALFSDQTGPGLEIAVGLGVIWLTISEVIVPPISEHVVPPVSGVIVPV
jgi:hypothetical protein